MSDTKPKKTYALGPMLDNDKVAQEILGAHDPNVKKLRSDLANLQKKIDDIQTAPANNPQLEQQIQSLSQLVHQALESSERLKVSVTLPPEKDMTVRLVTTHSIERLEEYKADENIAYLLIGLFGGSSLGIIGNWATSDDFATTKVSILLLLLMLALAIGSILWVYRIERRAAKVRSKILDDENQPLNPPPAQSQDPSSTVS